MNTLNELTDLVVKFRNERDWQQFHNAKDLALAISIEASELNELFLWKKAEEADAARIREELADIFTFALLLAHEQKIDISEIVRNKLEVSAKKYPVDKAKGNAKKYNEL
jgi:NTP pyrophosphatase (non-canonical NTP hydrolase)